MEAFADRIDKFTDYFITCGLDLKTGLEPDFVLGKLIKLITLNVGYHQDTKFVTILSLFSIFKGENQLQNTPLDRGYKCHVLTHYPESVPWNPLDKDAICLVSNANYL